MSRKNKNCKVIEKGISYVPVTDTYVVHHSIPASTGGTYLDKSYTFPTLEDARVFRDTCTKLALERKTLEIYNAELSNLLKDEPWEYPFNVFKACGLNCYDYSPDLLTELDTEVYDKMLSAREEQVCSFYFKDRFGTGKRPALKDIAREFGTTSERVRQIIAKAVRKYKWFIVCYEKILYRRHLEHQTKMYEERIKELRLADIPPVDVLLEGASIDELDFSIRTYNCLRRAGIQTVKDLVNCTEEDLLKIRNFGRKCVKEVKDRLEREGLHLFDSNLVE